VRGLSRPEQALRVLSRRALEELGALEASVHELGALRNAALRIFVASRHAATVIAQREFWLEFSWADQEYRVAVRDGGHARATSLWPRPPITRIPAVL
jgi:hypothetical protein